MFIKRKKYMEMQFSLQELVERVEDCTQIMVESEYVLKKVIPIISHPNHANLKERLVLVLEELDQVIDTNNDTIDEIDDAGVIDD